MKTFKYITISALVILGFALFTMEILFSLERPKSIFSNYSEAKASGLMEKGWIPTFIPRSAVDIREQHDFDTNWVKMSFAYDVGDVKQTREACIFEQAFEGGIEFTCEYFSSNVSIKLYSNGEAELYSSPN